MMFKQQCIMCLDVLAAIVCVILIALFEHWYICVCNAKILQQANSALSIGNTVSYFMYACAGHCKSQAKEADRASS